MKEFKDLTIRGQKMRIVKDAIQQINERTFTPKHGSGYFNLDGYYGHTSIQKLLKIKDFHCEGCAKGAIFASCVLNVNRVKTSDDYTSENFQKRKLRKWFDPLELDMIETAFENGVVIDSTNTLLETDSSYNCSRSELGNSCIKFGSRYKNPKTRLLAILNNILENGQFKPEAKKRTVQA